MDGERKKSKFSDYSTKFWIDMPYHRKWTLLEAATIDPFGFSDRQELTKVGHAIMVPGL